MTPQPLDWESWTLLTCQKHRASKLSNSRLDRFGDGTNLVDLQIMNMRKKKSKLRTCLEEKSVTSLLFDGSLDSKRVGHKEIITDNLDLGSLVESRPSLPVVLVKRVFEGANVIFVAVAVVDFSELGTCEPFGFVRLGVLPTIHCLALCSEVRV